MKKNEETFFLFLQLIIRRIINESKNVVEESLMTPGKNGLLDFEKYFKINLGSFIPQKSVRLFTNYFLQVLEKDTIITVNPSL
jgi:hypothetical protein